MTAPALRIDRGIRRGAELRIIVDGESVVAFEGETVAAALIAAGRYVMRHSAKRNEPRSIYCGIGVCQECRMTIDDVINTRACMTPVHDGMFIKTQDGLGK